MTAAVTPLEARCEVCLGTGEVRGEGFLDCTSCDVAEQRAELDAWAEKHCADNIPSWDLWLIYQHGKAAGEVATVEGVLTEMQPGGALHQPAALSEQAAFEKAAAGCIFGDASRLDSAQDWFTQGYRAAPLACPDLVKRLTHERDALGQAISDAALKAGMYNGEVPLTGPHLIMFAQHLGEAASPVVPVAAQPVVPEGWVVTHNPPWPSFTDAANARYRYSACRVIAPMCTDTGFSNWTGATIEEALRAGCDALGLPYAAPSLEAQPAGEVVRTELNELIDSVLGNCYMGEEREQELASNIRAAMAQGDKV